MEENEKKKRCALIHFVLDGLLSALVLTGLSLLIVSVIYLSRDLSDELAGNLVTACSLSSVFLSSVFSGRKLKSRGLILGTLLGTFYSLSLYITGILAFGFSGFSKGLLSTLALSVLCGAIGGITGVNIRSRKKDM